MKVKLGNNKFTYILIGVVLLVVGIIGAALPTPETQTKKVTVVQQNATQQVKTSPAYESTVTDYKVVNPATIQFTARVKNTGNGSGTPNCKVKGTDSSGTYKGYDYFKIDPLEPSKEQTFNGNITITKEGAVYVTDMQITCS